jgi:outer membrane protein OmpA-like peptidoglycan-associated protein
MKRQVVALIVCGSIAVFASACATKKFVREQVGTAETKLGQRADTHEAALKETSDRTTANTQALEATGQRMTGFDSRLGEVNTLATDAKKEATAVGQAQKEAEAQFNQRFGNRNKYTQVETKIVYFDFAKADLRDEGINDLAEVAKALKADPNSVLELQGFADQRGTDRYNYQLTRDRVDAVTRYLVQKHGIDLRRIFAVGMGKAELAAGEKGNKDTFANSRRVELRLLAPQS